MIQEESLGRRVSIPREIETRLLVESARRCCLCVFLQRDRDQKHVQIAHLDRNKNNCSYDNLAVLCLDHHDEYDSRTSQSKGITPGELKEYKKRLTERVAALKDGPSFLLNNHGLVAELNPEHPRAPTSEHITNLKYYLNPFDVVARAKLCKDNADFNAQLRKYDLVGERDDDTSFSGNSQSITITGEDAPLIKRGHALVLVGDESRWNWWVAAFVKDQDVWERRCLLPVGGQKGNAPVCQIVMGQDIEVLVIEQITGYGTGLFQRSQVWHPLRKTRDWTIVDFPLHAYVNGWGLPFNRYIEGTIVQFPEYLYDGTVLEVQFKVRYDSSGQEYEEICLFYLDRRLVLTWDALGQFFVPSKNSNIFPQDVALFFDDDSKGFLKRNFAQLQNLAISGMNLQRVWLKAFLEPFQDTEEAKQIMKHF